MQLTGALSGALQGWQQGLFARDAAYDWLKRTIAEVNQFAPGTFPEGLRLDLEPVAPGDSNVLGLSAQVVRPDGILEFVMRYRRTADGAPPAGDDKGMFGMRRP